MVRCRHGRHRRLGASPPGGHRLAGRVQTHSRVSGEGGRGRPPASTTASGSTSRASASVLRITASFFVVTCTAPHPAAEPTLTVTGSKGQLETKC